MKTYIDKKPENENQSAVNDTSQRSSRSGFHLEDNRFATIAQLKKSESTEDFIDPQPDEVVQMVRTTYGGNPQGRGGKGKSYTYQGGTARGYKVPAPYKPF